MTYKEKFESSEHKAHYQNIATKILREMSALRSLVENSPIAPRRWVWELIQNAKDVHLSEGVKIIIEYQPDFIHPFLAFRHNGKPFTSDNIRYLIEQISSKDRSKDEEGKRKTTGKFGTGFLSTHLLSEIVIVEGIAKEPELDYRKFKIILDRRGFELEQITDAVQKAEDSILNLDKSPAYTEYIEGNFNTEFNFFLVDEVGLKVAQAGLDDLNNCLPYTLAFVEEIKNVEIIPINRVYSNTLPKNILDKNVNCIFVEIYEKEKVKEPHIFTIVILRNGLTSIAIPVKKDIDEFEILPIGDEIPRLFCDFPLIGTHKFHFPVIINNPNFNPTDSRDGIFLTTSHRANPYVEENKTFIKEALELFFQLLEFATKINGKIYIC